MSVRQCTIYCLSNGAVSVADTVTCHLQIQGEVSKLKSVLFFYVTSAVVFQFFQYFLFLSLN
jgi:hypothetical protein